MGTLEECKKPKAQQGRRLVTSLPAPGSDLQATEAEEGPAEGDSGKERKGETDLIIYRGRIVKKIVPQD